MSLNWGGGASGAMGGAMLGGKFGGGWGAVGGGILGGAMGLFSGGGGGGGYGTEIDWSPPVWSEDEYYKPTQDYLFDYGKDVMQGELPDYYKPVGEYGGPEFEGFMDNVLRDTRKNVEESAIARGTGRSGVTDVAVSKAMGDVDAQYRYKDYLRAMNERSGLMRFGTDVVSGVRGAGLTYQGQENQFNLGVSRLELEKELAEAGYGYKQSMGDQSFYSDLMGSGMELAGTMFGSRGPRTTDYDLGSASAFDISKYTGGASSLDASIDKFGRSSYVY